MEEEETNRQWKPHLQMKTEAVVVALSRPWLTASAFGKKIHKSITIMEASRRKKKDWVLRKLPVREEAGATMAKCIFFKVEEIRFVMWRL